MKHLHVAALATILSASSVAWAGPYTLRPIGLRKQPAPRAPVLRQLDANSSLRVIEPANQRWLHVSTLSGVRGYLPKSAVGRVHIEVFKEERQLVVLRDDIPLRSYRAAFAPKSRHKDKVRQGDLATPLGRFYISGLDKNPRAPRYGARSMLLSYPNAEDARRGLSGKLISGHAYRSITGDIRAGRTPSQATRLGSSIRIHGGGSAEDWTAGCVALDDEAVKEVFEGVGRGTRVDIYRSRKEKVRLARRHYLGRRLLAAAQAQLKEPALYTNGAMSQLKIPFPGGDIRADWAVCTDIIVRGLRGVGLDLQALVHEDALAHPKRYRGLIAQPNHQIDHRRARNLQRFFSHHLIVLPEDRDYAPGDIVLMNAILGNGTPFDHVGIVDDRRDSEGRLQVINIWTVGYRTASMALIGKAYPKITGHFRLPHPFDLP